MKLMLCLIPILIISITLANATKLTCGDLEEYNDCGSCDASCDNPNPICAKGCRKGCYCKKGCVRGPNKKCIVRQNCPIVCGGENEEYNDCGNEDATCIDPSSRPKSKSCKKGCYCKQGCVRNSKNKCVQQNKCRCAPNEEYTDCAPDNHPTCENPKATYKSCKPGCKCINGCVKKSKKCVKIEECKKSS